MRAVGNFGVKTGQNQNLEVHSISILIFVKLKRLFVWNRLSKQLPSGQILKNNI